jgi:hypothetical protein
MPPIAVILILIIILLVVLLTAAVVTLRRLADRSVRSMHDRYPDALLVVRNANFFGQESLGVMQGRGSGTLAVTPDGIEFERWFPRKQFSIAARRITGVETPRGFLGKTHGRKLLRVNFTHDDGRADAMAWYVPDLDAVKRQVEALSG